MAKVEFGRVEQGAPSLRCPSCSSSRSVVTSSKPSSMKWGAARVGAKRRLRECFDCGALFVTYEFITGLSEGRKRKTAA